MKEIYADFNELQNDGVLPLTCVGSVESIAGLEEPLSDGEEVWFSDGELLALCRLPAHEHQRGLRERVGLGDASIGSAMARGRAARSGSSCPDASLTSLSDWPTVNAWDA
jgi:hypothetical protein